MGPVARSVEPEWLDALAADDPRGARSRRDLRRVNACMLQEATMAREVMWVCGGRPPRRWLDLGAGDGTFMLRVARRLAPAWRGVALVLLDRQDIVTGDTRKRFEPLGWETEPVAADVFDFLSDDRTDRADFDLVTANLVLHHFEAQRLCVLLRLVARRTATFVACEPRRGPAALFASHMLWAIGCNDVTRHDAVVSVRAGFRDRDLSAAWPEPSDWVLREGPAVPFTHRFSARRLAPP